VSTDMKITVRRKRELNPAFKRFQQLPDLGMCRPPAPARAGLPPVVLGGTSRGGGNVLAPAAVPSVSNPAVQPEASGPI
jgi:hypothetical protein